ncbi:uncharacterized protein EI97DRAFT_497951 [Westerdykella ornata]|uniref:GPI anchored cell wall protein n=1 Tax=Westerdykella ornata TaxID=318751 RepID=A0A6A6JXI3_WESOR|nr:uncharacterized protein EI97DRAFT_497951 [Westerdykella ornata]KAF2281332.1 hypothetical protein EI97DRAFT_497951 [Westerdykella ornata]
MRSYTAAAALAALASTSHAATVTLQETPCLQPTELKTYTVEVGKLVVVDMPSICGLKLVSTSDPASAPLEAITCQLFKDAAGQVPGSAKFTFASPALIATNPVQEGSIRCDVGAAPASSSTGETQSVTTVVSPVTATGTGMPVGGGYGNGNGTLVVHPTATPTGSQTPPGPEGAANGLAVGTGVGLTALMLVIGALVL